MIKKSMCPHCHGHYTKRDGRTSKGFNRFYCYFCKRYWQDTYVRPTLDQSNPQQQLFNWARSHPILSRYLIAIPSRRYYRPADIARLLASGMPPGVSDILLAYPVKHYHGLWIGFARSATTDCATTELTPHVQWVEAMQAVGYEVKLAAGWQEAAQKIEEYLTLLH